MNSLSTVGSSTSSLVFTLWVFFLSCALACAADTKVSALWHVPATEVVSQELRFSNGEAHLVGTVCLPKTGDHLPAVVALHSASAATREAGLYRHLCEGLPAIGFAVLIYDRRGSGQSSGNIGDANYETLADDAIAGQRALAAIPRIDPARIGFWGLSQGGWLAVLAAGRSSNAAFAISISAPLVSADDQMRFATRNLLKLRGYSDSDVREMLDTRSAWTGYLRGNNSRDAAAEALKNAQSKPWFELSYLPTADRLSRGTERQVDREQLDDDPFAAATKVKSPLLFMYGDSDPWVPVGKSVERLQEMAGRQHNFEYVVVPNANHEMMSPFGERMEITSESIRNDTPQAPLYFILLGSWLSRQASK